MTANAQKAMTGLLKAMIVLAVLLFVPAWTLRFREGWVYLAIMASCSAAIILYLARHDDALIGRRLKAGPVAEKEKSQKVIQGLTSVFGIILYLVPGFDARWQWSQVPMALVVIGQIGVALGFFITFLVFRENTYASSIIEVTKDQKVISSGPYAIVRHPMYVGVVLLFLATPLALNSWWAFIPAIALSAMIAVRLIDEEKFLVASLSGYDDYCRDVRYRLVPGIW